MHSDPDILGVTSVFVGTRVPFRNLVGDLERDHRLAVPVTFVCPGVPVTLRSDLASTRLPKSACARKMGPFSWALEASAHDVLTGEKDHCGVHGDTSIEGVRMLRPAAAATCDGNHTEREAGLS